MAIVVKERSGRAVAWSVQREKSVVVRGYSPFRALALTFRVVGLLLLLAVSVLPCQAQDFDLAEEPPKVVALLDEAITLEQELDSPDLIVRVAELYCSASRLGSLEAQYRFGLFYLKGSGAPRNVVFAANLFSLAAQRGHAKAMDMLEKVNLRNIDLPACML